MASKFVATTDLDAYAMYPTKILALSVSNDYPFTSLAVGPIAATLTHIAFERKLGGNGAQLDILENKVPKTTVLQTISSGLVVHPTSETFFYVEAANIWRVDYASNAGTVLTGLPSPPDHLAIDSKAVLYWTALDATVPPLFGGASDGKSGWVKLYAIGSPIQCLATGTNAVYWVSQGVPFKGHK